MNREKLLLETLWDYICCSFICNFFPILSYQFYPHIYNTLFLPLCLSCLRVRVFSSFFFFFSILTEWKVKRRTCRKGNRWHFEAAAVLMSSQSPSALLLPVAISCCLHVGQKAALITPNRRGGDMTVVPFWQSPGEDPCGGWLSDSASGRWAGAVGWAGCSTIAYKSAGLRQVLTTWAGCNGGIPSEQRCILQMPEWASRDFDLLQLSCRDTTNH